MNSIAAKRRLLVADVMTAHPVTLPSGAMVHEAARLMREHNIGAIPVVDDGLLSGIVTDRDLVTRALATGEDLSGVPLSHVTTRGPICTRPSQHAADAMAKMREHCISRLPVIDHGRVVGMLSMGDLAVTLEDRTTLAAVFAGRHAGD